LFPLLLCSPQLLHPIPFLYFIHCYSVLSSSWTWLHDFFFPQALVATSRSSNLIGSFTSPRTNHRPHRLLYNNVCTCCSGPLTVKPIGCPGTHDAHCVTFQKSENLMQPSCVHLTTIKINNTIQFDKLFC
jgi:hypothetical protein